VRALAGGVLALFFVSRLAAADTGVAVDAEGAIPTTPSALLSGGGGLGIRFGDQFHLPLLRLTVETGYAYARLVKENAPADWTLHRVHVGGRVGLGEVIVGVVFAHVGYGWRVTHDDSYGGGGLAYDAGLGVDLNLSVVSLGVHAGYNHIDAQPVAPQWISLGLDAAVYF
jgi:hypothetical protein